MDPRATVMAVMRSSRYNITLSHLPLPDLDCVDIMSLSIVYGAKFFLLEMDLCREMKRREIGGSALPADALRLRRGRLFAVVMAMFASYSSVVASVLSIQPYHLCLFVLLRFGAVVFLESATFARRFHTTHVQALPGPQPTSLVPVSMQGLDKREILSVLKHEATSLPSRNMAIERSDRQRYAISYVQLRTANDEWRPFQRLENALLELDAPVWIDRFGHYQGIADHDWAIEGIEPYKHNRVLIVPKTVRYTALGDKLERIFGEDGRAAADKLQHSWPDNEEVVDVVDMARTWPVTERLTGTAYQGIYMREADANLLVRTLEDLYKAAKELLAGELSFWIKVQAETFYSTQVLDGGGRLDFSGELGALQKKYIERPPYFAGDIVTGIGLGRVAFEMSVCYNERDKTSFLLRQISGATTRQQVEDWCYSVIRHTFTSDSDQASRLRRMVHLTSKWTPGSNICNNPVIPVTPLLSMESLGEWLYDGIFRNMSIFESSGPQNQGWEVVENGIVYVLLKRSTRCFGHEVCIARVNSSGVVYHIIGRGSFVEWGDDEQQHPIDAASSASGQRAWEVALEVMQPMRLSRRLRLARMLASQHTLSMPSLSFRMGLRELEYTLGP